MKSPKRPFPPANPWRFITELLRQPRESEPSHLPAGEENEKDSQRETSVKRLATRLADQPPTTGKQVKPERFEELEAYRGIAALLIVVFHTYQYSREGMHLQEYVYEGTPLHVLFSNLEAAVAWFFVLSGFLIFLPFARAATNQDEPRSARDFLFRRAVRIVPLYYVAILIVWWLQYTGGKEQWIALLEHLTFTQVFDSQRIFWIIGPAWSLAVEVIFYLFIAGFGPLAYYACKWVSTQRARVTLLAGAALALVIFSVAYKWWAFYMARIPSENYPVYFGPLAKMDTFAIGMLLAVAVVAAKGRPNLKGSVPALLRLAGIALLAAAFTFRASSTTVELYIHSLAGLAFVLVLASTALGSRNSVWERVLAHPVLLFLGLVSYSVYMWHEPLMLELAEYGLLINKAPGAFPSNALLLVVISIFVATLSYWLVERPTLRLRHLFRRGQWLTQHPSKERN